MIQHHIEIIVIFLLWSNDSIFTTCANNHSPYSSHSHPLLPRNRYLDTRLLPVGGRARIISGCSIELQDDDFASWGSSSIDWDPRFEKVQGILDRPPRSILDEEVYPSGNYISFPSQAMLASSKDEEDIRLALRRIPWNMEQNQDIGNTNLRQKYLKTGTTIVGVQTREGIILAADTRATEGSVVADTKCEKVHQLCQNIWCCGAGTSGDLDALTRKVRYTSLLKTMLRDTIGNDGPDSPEEWLSQQNNSCPLFQSEEEIDINQHLGKASVSNICHVLREELTRGRGQIGANLVLGGVDPYTQQPVLVAIHPHGSIDVVPYTALGSGGLSAMGVLESRYRADMTIEEGVELVKDAVLAGIKNDLGSGSQVDMIIIKPDEVQYQRAVVVEEQLIISDDDVAIENELFQRHAFESDAKVMGGVNGFGSLPYQVKSRKVVMHDEEVVAKHQNQWLSTLLY